MGLKNFRSLILRIGIIILIIIVSIPFIGPATAQEPTDLAPTTAQDPPGSAPAVGPEKPPAAEPEQKPLRVPLTEVIGTGPEAMEHIPDRDA